MFPVGFDLDGAVKKAESEWNSTYYARLNKAVQRKPFSISVKFDTKKLGSLSEVKKRLAAIKLQPVTPETKNAISSLVKELKTLEKILKRIDALNAANARGAAAAGAQSQLAAQRAARAAAIQAKSAAQQKQDASKLAILEERKKQAIIRTAEAERKRAEAISRANKAYRSQGGYIDRLIKRTAVCFSIYKVLNFVKAIQNVTAEFELQRVSLGTIIQDTQKATLLFNQIKDFAVKSPFEIKDLVSYTKQLSAYQIETDQLFDTMRRLADVSAGLGVSMDRIILAYGQVKAASVLRGSELRQFTEAGIPLVKMLADKFTRLRGEMVSTAEVFDLISKRAVSFEMVKETFEDMTNAGGIFYKMQEKQAETLAGQISNLKDAFSIMFDEMGRSSGIRSMMDGYISVLKNMADHWQGVSSFITYAAVAALLYSKTVNKTAMSVEKQIWAEKELEAQRLRSLTIGGALEDSDRRRLMLTRSMTASDYKRLILEGKLNSLQVIRMARQSANNRQLERGIVLSGKLTREQVKAVQSASGWNYAMRTMRVRLQNLGGAFVSAARSVGMFLKSMLPILAVSEIISMFTQWADHLDQLDEALKKNEKEFQEYENTLQRIENAYRSAEEAARRAADADKEFANAAYGDKIAQLQQIAKLLDNLGMKNIIDFSVLDAGNIDKVEEVWLGKLKEINGVVREWGAEVADVATAYAPTLLGWSMFGENLEEDMKDLRREWTKLTTDRDFAGELERMRLYVEKMADDSKEFYKNLSDAVGEDAKLALSEQRRNETSVQYWNRILKNYRMINTLAKTGNPLKGTYNAFQSISVDVRDELAEVMHEFDKTFDMLRDKDPVTIKAAIDRIFLQHEWDDSMKELFINEANRKYNLKIPVTFDFQPEGSADTGVKSILRSEFPSLFTQEELDKMGGIPDIIGAIKKKMEDSLSTLKVMRQAQNNVNAGAEKYEGVIKDINEELKKEREKPLADRDNKRIADLEKELALMRTRNKAYDEQIEKERKDAEQSYADAKQAYDRIAGLPLSSVAEDFRKNFPGLVTDAMKEATDKDYPINLTVSEKDLEGMKNAGDLYDWWVQAMENLAKENEKIKDIHVSDAQIERERAELAERQKRASEDLARTEKMIKDKGYEWNYEEYKRLKYNLAIAATLEEQKRASEDLDRFRKNSIGTEETLLYMKMEQLNATLMEKKTSGEIAKENLDAYRGSLKETDDFLKAVAERYNFKMPDKDKGGGSGEDPWIMLMKNRMKFMQDFQKGVEDLSKFLQKTKALGQEQDIMLFRGKTLDIDVNALNGTQEELVAWFDDAIDQVSKKIAKLGGKMWEGLGVKAILAKDTKSRIIKAYQDLLQDLFNQKTDFQTKKLKEQMEAEMKRIADEVAKTKTAKEFFDNMLDLTGDRELSATVTADIYGDTGAGLKQKIIDQITGLFQYADGEQIDLSEAINYKTLEINYLKLAEIVEENSGRISEKSKEAIDGITAAGIKATAERIANWEKEIQKEMSYSQKRVMLADKTAKAIAEIESMEGPGREEKDRLKSGIMENEKAEAADLAWEAFRESPFYVSVFDNLDEVSSRVLKSLISRLNEFKEANGQAFSPTDMKQWQDSLNELNNELAERSPIKTMIGAFKEWQKLRKEGRTREGDEEAYIQAVQKEVEMQRQFEEAVKERLAAELEYQEAVRSFGIESDEAAAAAKRAREASEKAQNKGRDLDNSKQDTENAKEAADEWKKLSERIDDFWKLNGEGAEAYIRKIGKISESIASMGNDIANMMEGFGASDEDVQFVKDIAGGFSKIGGGISQILSGNPFAAIGGVANIVTGIGDIFSAGKVRRANKEIKKQQELIDGLSHSYERLQKLADNLFAAQFVQNYREQTQNLQAQIVATQKQLEAEKSKGSRKDKKKIKEYEEKIQELKDELADMQSHVADQFLGEDLASAARTFADSWIEAYKEFGDTRAALEESMKDMMKNLMQEAVLGAISQAALKPLYDYINSVANSDNGSFADPNVWREIKRLSEEAYSNMDAGLSVWGEELENLGVLSREMDGMGGDLTGISKDIATASEESILGLAAGINTQNFYISHIDASVSQILAIMAGGGAEFTNGSQITDLVTVQNQHLSYLPTIAQNTAEIITRAERAAIACESIAANMDRVVKPRGVKGSHAVNVEM